MNKTEILNRLSSSDEERLLFARLLHKEKIPASALLGLVFAVAGMFALLLEL